MGIDANKVHLSVGGSSILARSLRTLERCDAVVAVVVVHRAIDDALTADCVREARATKVVAVVPGGSSRTKSELAGLQAVAALRTTGASFDLVLVHDAARPFVSVELIDRLVAAAALDGGAVPGLAVTEPIYVLTGDTVTLIDGQDLRRMQTPQVFRTDAVLAAYAAAAATGFEGLDTAQTVERFCPDISVRVVAGDPANLKVTTATDLATAARLANASDGGHSSI